MPRPTTPLRAAIAALTFIALLAPPADAAKRKPTCLEAKGRTVERQGAARLFTRPGSEPEGRTLFGCTSRQRPQRLFTEYDDDYVSSRLLAQTELAGRFAAVSARYYDISCKAACPPDYDSTSFALVVYDLRNRTQSVVKGYGGQPFVLTTSGAVAWIAGDTVLAFHKNALTELDKGPIGATSLEASTTRVSWIHGTELRAASLPF